MIYTKEEIDNAMANFKNAIFFDTQRPYKNIIDGTFFCTNPRLMFGWRSGAYICDILVAQGMLRHVDDSHFQYTEAGAQYAKLLRL